MLFILLGVSENNKNLAKNEYTETAQVLFSSFPIPNQTWLSAQSFSTQAPEVFSHAEHPLKVTIPSTCHDKWRQLWSYCVIQLEHGATLHCLPVFCLLSTYLMAKEAFAFEGASLATRRQAAHGGEEGSKVPFCLFYLDM